MYKHFSSKWLPFKIIFGIRSINILSDTRLHNLVFNFTSIIYTYIYHKQTHIIHLKNHVYHTKNKNTKYEILEVKGTINPQVHTVRNLIGSRLLIYNYKCIAFKQIAAFSVSTQSSISFF